VSLLRDLVTYTWEGLLDGAVDGLRGALRQHTPIMNQPRYTPKDFELRKIRWAHSLPFNMSQELLDDIVLDQPLLGEAKLRRVRDAMDEFKMPGGNLRIAYTVDAEEMPDQLWHGLATESTYEDPPTAPAAQAGPCKPWSPS